MTLPHGDWAVTLPHGDWAVTLPHGDWAVTSYLPGRNICEEVDRLYPTETTYVIITRTLPLRDCPR